MPLLMGMCAIIYQKQQFSSAAMFLRSYLGEIAGLLQQRSVQQQKEITAGYT